MSVTKSQASARGAVSSVFGTITSTAQAVTSLFDTANESVGMAAAYVETAAKKQRDSHKVDLHTSRKVLMERVAMEEAERRVDIQKFRSTSTEHDKLFVEAYTDLEALFAE